MQFERHVFVCTSGKVCPRQGAETVHSELRGLVASAGLKDRVRVNKCGCLGQCGYGPIVVTYPEGTWYAGVLPSDVEEIFATHLVGGLPVDRLRYRPPGSGVQICPPGEEVIVPAPSAT